jgi:hypothetical protein
MRKHLLILLVLGAAATGCGTNALGAYEQLLNAYCSFGARCGGGDAAAIEQCTKRLVDEVLSEGWRLDEAEAKGRIAIDGAKASACAAAVRDGDCTQLLGNAQCEDFIDGKVAIGGACADDAECDEGSFCSRPRMVAGCPGTCVALPTEGQPCASFRCADGLYCTGGTNALCARRLTENSPCNAMTQCQTGLTCREPSVGAPARICRRYGSAGQPCGATFLGHDCDRGFYCDTARQPSVCVARVGEGQPCRANDACADGLICMPVNGNELGSCQKPLVAGATCMPGATSACAFGLFCDPATSTCVARRPLEGQPCRSNDDCDEGTDVRKQLCDGETCRPVRLLGESCMPPVGDGPNPCAAGECSPTTRTCTLVCG